MSEYNWYLRDKKYKYGDYIKGKGYYNEDSGKWVNRLNKKIIVEKYIRYEFSNWNDKKILYEFGWNKVDRVGKYLFLIFKKSIEKYKRFGSRWVYIDKMNDEISLLGFNDYKKIVERLIELRLIRVKVGKIKYGKEVRIYRLNDIFFEGYRRRIWIRNSKLIDILDKRYMKLNLDDFVKWEIESSRRLSVVDNKNGRERLIRRRLSNKKIEDYKKVDYDWIGKRERIRLENVWSKEMDEDYINRCDIGFELMKEDIEMLRNGGCEFDMFNVDNFGGRLYNVINNKEKEFRRYLRLDDWNLVEIDMSNGYISLLCRVFKGIRELRKGNNKFDDKIKEIVGDCDGDDFLDRYEEICFKSDNRIDFYEYIGMKLDGIGVIDSDKRSYYKGLVLYLLNGKEEFLKGKKFIDNQYSGSVLGKMIFGERGWECLNKIKNIEIDGFNLYGYETYKNISKLLMKMEVIIMRERWKELIKNDIPYLSLFDGFLIRSKDMDYVMNMMNRDYGIDNCIKFRVSKEYNKKGNKKDNKNYYNR